MIVVRLGFPQQETEMRRFDELQTPTIFYRVLCIAENDSMEESYGRSGNWLLKKCRLWFLKHYE